MELHQRQKSRCHPRGPLVLLILDGVGEGNHGYFDCVFQASTPNLDLLMRSGLATKLDASGPAVGLLGASDMGNSEVGHNTMGAGRVFDQGAKLIDAAFESGDVWLKAWPSVIKQIRDTSSVLHLVGLLSHGRIHSDSAHLYRILEQAELDHVGEVRIHILLDGRDVEDFTADEYITELEGKLADCRRRGLDYKIASGGGRMVTTMDRYGANWAVVEAGWQAHVLGTARPFPSALEAVNVARAENQKISDQNIPAFTVVGDSGLPLGAIADGDIVLVFNFRGDRVIEFCNALVNDSFVHFDRMRMPKILLVAMTQYERESGFPETYLVEPPRIRDTVSEILCEVGIKQFACAETQKFGHVTYFWNGNRSEPFDALLEMYVEIPSDTIPFDQRPWMKSAETADTIIRELREGNSDFLRANFAGGDMVGHTANLQATVIAIEAIDLAVGRIMNVIEEFSGCLIVTADHGNAEDMVETENGAIKVSQDGDPILKTSHSVNKVPFVIMDYGRRPIAMKMNIGSPGLANVASTIVELLGYVPPDDYEPSLIEIGAIGPIL